MESEGFRLAGPATAAAVVGEASRRGRGRAARARPRFGGGESATPGGKPPAAAGARNPKESDGLLRETQQMRFRFIAAEKAQYPIALLCRCAARLAERFLSVGAARHVQPRSGRCAVNGAAAARACGQPAHVWPTAIVPRAPRPGPGGQWQARRSFNARGRPSRARTPALRHHHRQPPYLCDCAESGATTLSAAPTESRLGGGHDRLPSATRLVLSRGGPRPGVTSGDWLGGQGRTPTPGLAIAALMPALPRVPQHATLLHHSDRGIPYASDSISGAAGPLSASRRA